MAQHIALCGRPEASSVRPIGQIMVMKSIRPGNIYRAGAIQHDSKNTVGNRYWISSLALSALALH